MLDSIYSALELTFLILAVIYLVFITVSIVKEKSSTVPIKKVQIVMTSTMCLIFFFQVIIGILSEKTAILIGGDIFCLILWILNTGFIFRSLKNAKDRVSDLEIHIIISPVIEDEKTEKDCDTEKIDVITDANNDK